MAKTNTPAVDFRAQLEQQASELNSGNSRAGFIREGATAVLLIGPAKVGPFYVPVTDVFQGKGRTKYMAFAYVAKAQDASKMPEGWNEKIVPLVLPKDVVLKVTKRLLAPDDGLTEPGALSVLNDDGTFAEVGTMFLIERSGKGLNTSYDVSIMPEKRAPAVPDSVGMPESDLEDVAAAYTQWQLTKDDGPADDDDSANDGESGPLF